MQSATIGQRVLADDYAIGINAESCSGEGGDGIARSIVEAEVERDCIRKHPAGRCWVQATKLDGNPIYAAALGYGLATDGRMQEARILLDQLKRRANQKNVGWNEIAIIHVGLGENEEALAALETAYRNHSAQLTWLKVDKRFKHLQSDARYQDLLRRIGLSL